MTPGRTATARELRTEVESAGRRRDDALAVAISRKPEKWHRDLLVFALLCTLWAALLIFRVVARDPFSSPTNPCVIADAGSVSANAMARPLERGRLR